MLSRTLYKLKSQKHILKFLPFRILIIGIFIFFEFRISSFGFEIPQSPTLVKGDKGGFLLSDAWYVVNYMGSQVGYSHIIQKTLIEETGELIATESNSYMELKLLDKKIISKENSIYYEDKNGKLIKFNSYIESPIELNLVSGIVDNDILNLSIKKGSGAETKESVNIKGLIFQSEILRLLKENTEKNNNYFSYRTYIPEFKKIIEVKIEVKEKENTNVNGIEKYLLKIVSKISELGITTNEWYDIASPSGVPAKAGYFNNFQLVKFETMGMVSYLTDPENIIKSDFGPDLTPELVIKTDIKLKNPGELSDLKLKFYNVNSKYFVSDERQAVESEGENAIVNIRRENLEEIPLCPPLISEVIPFTPPLVKGGEGGFYKRINEYLISNEIIQSDDSEIISIAKDIVGTEKNPAKQVEILRNWVFENLQKVEYKHLFLSAKETLKLMQGDCSEHAVLLAALTRAIGIPSKIYVGIVYTGNGNWGYHMWTGVNICGWVSVDAALNQFPVDVTHIAYAETSFSDEEVEKVKISLPFLAFHKKVKMKLISAE